MTRSEILNNEKFQELLNKDLKILLNDLLSNDKFFYRSQDKYFYRIMLFFDKQKEIKQLILTKINKYFQGEENGIQDILKINIFQEQFENIIFEVIDENILGRNYKNIKKYIPPTLIRDFFTENANLIFSEYTNYLYFQIFQEFFSFMEKNTLTNILVFFRNENKKELIDWFFENINLKIFNFDEIKNYYLTTEQKIFIQRKFGREIEPKDWVEVQNQYSREIRNQERKQKIKQKNRYLQKIGYFNADINNILHLRRLLRNANIPINAEMNLQELQQKYYELKNFE